MKRTPSDKENCAPINIRSATVYLETESSRGWHDAVGTMRAVDERKRYERMATKGDAAAYQGLAREELLAIPPAPPLH